MEQDRWLCGWRQIGKYIGKSGRTAQRYAAAGLPFFRDPGGRPMANRSQIDEYIHDLNRTNYDDKVWQDDGIDTALGYEEAKDQERKEFDERAIEAKRPVRSRF